MTTIKKRRAKAPAPAFDLQQVVERFTEFRRLKRAEAEAKSQHERIRDELMPLLEQHGRAHGETGAHQAIDLPEPVDGLVRLVRRANVSAYFDLDAAEALAEEKGILPEVQTVTLRMEGIPATQLDALQKALKKAGLEDFAPVLIDVRVEQDKVYAAHARDPKVITEADLDRLLVEETKFSFFPEKA